MLPTHVQDYWGSIVAISFLDLTKGLATISMDVNEVEGEDVLEVGVASLIYGGQTAPALTNFLKACSPEVVKYFKKTYCPKFKLVEMSKTQREVVPTGYSPPSKKKTQVCISTSVSILTLEGETSTLTFV